MQIIQISEKYKEPFIDVLIEVAVEELGFKQWEEDLRKFENLSYIENEGNCWIAIDSQENILGTISLRKIDNQHAEIKNLYIKKEARSTGLSSNLLECLMDFSKKMKYKKIQLSTDATLVGATKFYIKNGFKLIETKENVIKFELEI